MTFISRRDLLKAAAIVPLRADSRLARNLLSKISRRPRCSCSDAIVARLIPSDASGPGAIEAHGVALHRSRARRRAGVARRRCTAPASPRSTRYARSSRGAPFAQLSPTDQDSVLIDVETGAATGFTGSSAAFFAMVLLAHATRDVRRSVLRRQRELRRLGSHQLSRRPDDGECSGSEGPGVEGAEGGSQVGLRCHESHQGRRSPQWRLGSKTPTS